MSVHLALLEIGASYDLRRVDLDAAKHKDPEYLKLNPNGLVPTLLVEGKPFYESPALLMLLAERHPEAKLAPPPAAPERALYLQTMFHLTSTPQAAFRLWFHPEYGGSLEAEASVKRAARQTIEATWDRLAADLSSAGPYLLGSSFSVADVLAVLLMRWSRNMPKAATTWPALAEYALRIKARPAWKRLYEIDGLTEWA